MVKALSFSIPQVSFNENPMRMCEDYTTGTWNMAWSIVGTQFLFAVIMITGGHLHREQIYRDICTHKYTHAQYGPTSTVLLQDRLGLAACGLVAMWQRK
jgi:hypothetical protein